MAASGGKLLSVSEVSAQLGLSEVWVRRMISEGKLAAVKKEWRVYVPESSLADLAIARAARAAAALDDGTWATEAKVVAGVERHLKRQGWRQVSKANTATREAGIDLVMERDGVRLAVEAKGYSSRLHADGPKAGKLKTYPATQARSYMGDLLLTVLLLRKKQPEYLVAIAVPDRTTFTSLVARLERPLRKLGIGAYVVGPKGQVTELWAGAPRRR